MNIEQEFDFGKVIVDIKRAIIFIDTGDGKEMLEPSPENKEERKQIFDWLHDHSEIDYHDESRLSWKYKTYFNCGDTARLGEAPIELLKVESPETKDQVSLELIGTDRVYKLRRIPELGMVLINTEGLVHFLGEGAEEGDLNWMQWDNERGWSFKRDLDDLDNRFVKQIIGGRPERFFLNK